jgi:hypothetical protein
MKTVLLAAGRRVVAASRCGGESRGEIGRYRDLSRM